MGRVILVAQILEHLLTDLAVPSTVGLHVVQVIALADAVALGAPALGAGTDATSEAGAGSRSAAFDRR